MASVPGMFIIPKTGFIGRVYEMDRGHIRSNAE
jgi:hypothetical protein